MNNHPLISVVMASYNHAPFIKEAVLSVLNQTYKNFDLIITDDGSSDNSIEVINSIKSDKIKFFKFEDNQGACAALNNCIINSEGDYIAVINSDDIWQHDKLEKQLNVFRQDPSIDAVFSNADFLKEDLKQFKTHERPYFFNVFDQHNRLQGVWLRKFFFEGNFLCHPSILIKKSCYKTLGLYDNRFRQLPDFDMWIKFCKYFKLHILSEKLVTFRILNDGKNTSSPNEINRIRGRTEHHLIMQDFFSNMSISIFKEGFSDLLRNKNFHSKEEFEIEKALLYLNTVHSIIGLEMIYKFLREDKFKETLEKYQINDNIFQQFSGSCLTFSIFSRVRVVKDFLKVIKDYPKFKLLLLMFKHAVHKLKIIIGKIIA